MEIQWIVFEFFISFLEMLTSCYFIARVFRKELSVRRELLNLFLFAGSGALLLSMRENGILPIPDYFPAVLIVGLYAIFICKAKWWSAVLWALLNYLLIGIVVITINSGMSFVMNVPLDILRTRADFRVMKRVVVRLGQILVSVGVFTILKKVKQSATIYSKEVGLILMAIVSILALLGLWNIEFILTEDLILILNISICMLILLANFASLLFREVLSKSQSDNRELMEENRMISRQIRNQNEVNEMYNSMQGLKHDLNNHLHSILGYMQLGEYQKAEEYIWKISGEVADLTTYHSGNPVIDAIFGSKANLAQKEGIRVEVDLRIPSILHISEEHLTIVLGNLYDNAIDANLKIEDKDKRYIKARMIGQGKELLIYFENAVHRADEQENSDWKFWKTTKKDAYRHGFGLKNIDRVVNLYDGYCDRKLKEGVFTCSIRIPNERR